MAKHNRMQAEGNPEALEDAVPGSTNGGRRNGKPPKKRGGGILSTVLIVVGIALLIVAGMYQFRNMMNYKNIDDINDEIAQYSKLTDDKETPPSVDWAKLKEMNSDVVGWIEVPGTIVNYPVFQTGDNDYYLNHAPDHSQSIGGAVFLDSENTSPGMVDSQSIIYGHHMRNGSQFKEIADLDNQTLFDQIDLVWYCTEQGNHDLAPLFVYYTNADDTDVRQFSFESPDKFREYLRMYYAKAVTKRADAEAVINQVEHVLTLSTCNYIDGEGRTLLVCVPRDEIPGTPQYEAAEPARAQKRAEEAAAAQAAAAQAAAEQAAAEQAAPEGEEYVEEVVTEEVRED